MARLRRLPTRVWTQLGAIPVVYQSPVVDDDGTTCWGTYDPVRRVIAIDNTATPEAQWQALIHEGAHAWLLDAGIRLGAKEEYAIDAFANGAYNLLLRPERRRR